MLMVGLHPKNLSIVQSLVVMVVGQKMRSIILDELVFAMKANTDIPPVMAVANHRNANIPELMAYRLAKIVVEELLQPFLEILFLFVLMLVGWILDFTRVAPLCLE